MTQSLVTMIGESIGAGAAPDPRTIAPPIMGIITDTLRATLRDMAQSDARLYRGLAELTDTTTAPVLPPDLDSQIAAAIALLEANGYTVTR